MFILYIILDAKICYLLLNRMVRIERTQVGLFYLVLTASIASGVTPGIRTPIMRAWVSEL